MSTKVLFVCPRGFANEFSIIHVAPHEVEAANEILAARADADGRAEYVTESEARRLVRSAQADRSTQWFGAVFPSLAAYERSESSDATAVPAEGHSLAR